MSAIATVDCDVLVVGAGPAGLAAAGAAARAGAGVVVLDDNAGPGGQIWRGAGAGVAAPDARAAAPWLDALEHPRVQPLAGARLFAQPAPGLALAETPAGPLAVRHVRAVLCPGARELFLPFPGWTLPGVAGAGGLSALVKSGTPVAGQRVVVAGSGPLLFAVARELKRHGARVLLIAEQAPRGRVARFAAGLWRWPAKLADALAHRAALAGVPYRTGSWPVEALGGEALAAVRVSDGRRVREIPCDRLACGFGLVPNAEPARLFGCAIAAGGAVATGARQETSVPGVFAAGEAAGIAGLEAALAEGAIAGLAAAGAGEIPAGPRRARERARAFGAAIARAFALRDDLRALARPETVVCRCEDVTRGALADQPGWRAAKLHTRCGMGPCQGRVCGPAAEFLFGWGAESVRPPAFPVRLESLAAAGEVPPGGTEGP
ncbi:MAG: FAD-dependent oxidoreductase [Acidobacteria bacterium]|nr:FAD-dependent oxidoreductase [Acidobacteriota bacterium]